MKIKVTFFIIICFLSFLALSKVLVTHKDINAFDIDYINLKMIKDYKANVLVNFCTNNNSMCNAIQPNLKALFTELNTKKIKIFNINIFNNTDMLNDFPIAFIPIQFFFTKDGKSYKPSDELGIKFNSTNINNTVFYYHHGMLSKDEISKILKTMENI